METQQKAHRLISYPVRSPPLRHRRPLSMRTKDITHSEREKEKEKEEEKEKGSKREEEREEGTISAFSGVEVGVRMAADWMSNRLLCPCWARNLWMVSSRTSLSLCRDGGIAKFPLFLRRRLS